MNKEYSEEYVINESRARTNALARALQQILDQEGAVALLSGQYYVPTDSTDHIVTAPMGYDWDVGGTGLQLVSPGDGTARDIPYECLIETNGAQECGDKWYIYEYMLSSSPEEWDWRVYAHASEHCDAIRFIDAEARDKFDDQVAAISCDQVLLEEDDPRYGDGGDATAKELGLLEDSRTFDRYRRGEIDEDEARRIGKICRARHRKTSYHHYLDRGYTREEARNAIRLDMEIAMLEE